MNEEFIYKMELKIIKPLSKLEIGCGMRKWKISIESGIPIDFLTVFLKRMKISGKVEIITTWDKFKDTPNGSAYCLTKNN